ncbi:Ubiquitin carboxyl-terminal hydrolase 24 [Phytophthora cinnamomi]|uniref:Ubiquitin carboxyl-terminal hydrolase 24 n=1 Tax=Phytophthora cinnamomi TaxID=4785 RepID=UPI00355A25F8|nr:Ubiquitin carboxyl-terminal hydrolase 24 [Phytophthora cinnamomi]
MFTTECLILTEYLKSFTPAFYVNFLFIMVRLPSAQYHRELDGITQENVMHTLLPVFYYGLLEFVSFLLFVFAIRRTIGMDALYHLAFVLETQTSLIQSKLIVWMLLTLTFRVVHYGFDFTFQFSWIKARPIVNHN